MYVEAQPFAEYRRIVCCYDLQDFWSNFKVYRLAKFCLLQFHPSTVPLPLKRKASVGNADLTVFMLYDLADRNMRRFRQSRTLDKAQTVGLVNIYVIFHVCLHS